MTSPELFPVPVAMYTTPPEALVELLLRSQQLYSLPLVRRLRFTRLPGGITEHSRILFSSTKSLEDRKGAQGESSDDDYVPFAAAYLDFSRAPETELWIFSSMERRIGGRRDDGDAADGKGQGKEEREKEIEAERQEIASTVALLREVKRQRDKYFALDSTHRDERTRLTVLIGNMNEVLRTRLVAPDVGMKIVSTGLYDKWLFHVDELPDVELPEILHPLGSTDQGEMKGEGKRWSWDIVRRQDLGLTISRTHITRRERTMKLLPSTALYLDDGTPVAWAFLGPDSSLSSLHCEEPYRGKGIAKAVAVRSLRANLKNYVDDGQPAYGWADVAPDNLQSRGVCKSLMGKVKWQISWSLIDLDLSFPNP